MYHDSTCLHNVKTLILIHHASNNMSLIFEDTQIRFTEDELLTATTLSSDTINSPLYQILKGGKLPSNHEEEDTQTFSSDLILSSTNKLVLMVVVATVVLVVAAGLVVLCFLTQLEVAGVIIVAITAPAVFYWAWREFFVSVRRIRISFESRAVILEYFVRRNKVIDIEDIEMPYIEVDTFTNEKLPLMYFNLCIPNRRGPKIEHQLAIFETKFAESKPLSAKDEVKLEQLISTARQVVQLVRLKSSEDQPTALELRYNVKVCLTD